MSRRRTTSARALPALLGVLGVLVLGGCASGEEEVPLGADGSGSFRTEDRLTATLTDPDGTAVGRVQADESGGLRLRVQVDGLEPGSYDVRLVPGADCTDDARPTGGEDADTTGLPQLEVRGSGGGSFAESATELSLGDVEDGAAVVLVGEEPVACGVLADY